MLLSFSVLILVLSMSLHAKMERAASYQKWGYTKLQKATVEGRTIETKFFQRYVYSGSDSWPVATITFTKISNSKDGVNLEEIAKELKLTAFTSQLIERKGKDSILLEGFWKKMNRNVRATIIKLPNEGFAMIFATMRTGYTSSVLPEVNGIFDLLYDYSKNGLSKISINSFPGIEEAFAQSSVTTLTTLLTGAASPSGPSTTPGATPTSPLAVALGGSSADVTALTTSLDTLNAQLPATTAAIDHAATAVEGLTAELPAATAAVEHAATALDGLNAQLPAVTDAANNLATAATKISDQIPDILSTADKGIDALNDINKTVKDNLPALLSQMDGVNKNWSDTLKLAENVLKPENLFQMAFASAAGAALGTLAVNVVAGGIELAVRAIIDLINTGAREKEERWVIFRKALDQWDKMDQMTRDLEKIVDSFLNSFEILDKHKGEDLVAALKKGIVQLKLISMKQKKIADSTESCDDCEERQERAYLAYLGLEDLIKSNQSIVDYLEKENVKSIKNDDSFFCDKLAALKRKLVDAEILMNNLRTSILAGQEEWVEDVMKRLEKEEKNIARINDPGVRDAIKKKQTDVLKKAIENAKRQDKDEIDDNSPWMRGCLNAYSSGDGGASGDIGLKIYNKHKDDLFREIAIYFECRDEFAKTHKVSQSVLENRNKMFASVMNAMDLSAYQGRGEKVKVNYELYMKEVSEMNSWFQKIRNQLICLEEETKANPNKGPACNKEFPQMMSLDNTLKRAEKAWEKQCADKMKNLSSTLAY